MSVCKIYIGFGIFCGLRSPCVSSCSHVDSHVESVLLNKLFSSGTEHLIKFGELGLELGAGGCYQVLWPCWLAVSSGDRAAVEFELRRQKEQKQINSKVLLLVFEINRKSTERYAFKKNYGIIWKACSKSLNWSYSCPMMQSSEDGIVCILGQNYHIFKALTW